MSTGRETRRQARRRGAPAGARARGAGGALLHLVLNHGDFHTVVPGQDVVDQRCLTGTQKPGDNGDGGLLLLRTGRCHGLRGVRGAVGVIRDGFDALLCS